jgi:hypothetical protein
VAPASRAVDDAEQRTDRQLAPHVKPRLELLPAPCIHADLATAPALAASNQERATALIEIAFGESERFLDAQPGSPHDHDEPAEAAPVGSVTGRAHDGHDLFDLRRVGRVAQTVVPWRVASVESRQCRGRSTSTGASSSSSGMILLGLVNEP